MRKIIALLIVVSMIAVFVSAKEKSDNELKKMAMKKASEEMIKMSDTEGLIDYSKGKKVVLKTNKGDIELKFYPEKAPMAVYSFIKHSADGYYDGVIFHRVIKDFMIQGGDPTSTGRAGKSVWGKDFGDEFSSDLKFDKKGILAMANAGPGTNGSQFFITLVPTVWLNNKHTIFGYVSNGMDVVEAIGQVEVSPRLNRPLSEIKIEKAEVIEIPKDAKIETNKK